MTPTDLRRALEEALHDHLGGMVPIAGSKIDLTFRALLDIGTNEAFLAAAMMLRPVGWVASVTVFHDDASASMADDRVNPRRCPDIHTIGPTPALALLSAIEQARSAERG